jgi:hypothetical protein
MKKTARILISMLMTAGALVGIVSVAPSAYAMCDYDQVYISTPYNGTWSRSTTTSSSFTSRWAYHFSVPTDTLYRARAYKLGYIYKYKRTTTYLGGCAPQVSWLYAATPVRSNTGTYYWGLERYSNAGKYRYDAL